MSFLDTDDTSVFIFFILSLEGCVERECNSIKSLPVGPERLGEPLIHWGAAHLLEQEEHTPNTPLHNVSN